MTNCMGRKKPPLRFVIQRSSDNQKRQLCLELPTQAARKALAARATYRCYSKHKYHPRAFGVEPYSGLGEDRTYCDAHADFQPKDMARVGDLLIRGIMAALWSENTSQGDPSQLWTIDDNGWIYELRITIPSRAEYHGYPLLPNDAFGRQVLARFIEADPTVPNASRAAQQRYR